MQFLKPKGDTQSEYYNVFGTELFSAIIIPAIATIVAMTLQNDTVICTDSACYLHRHSWVCFVGWVPVNIWIYSMITMVATGITTIPFHYIVYAIVINIIQLIYKVFCKLISFMRPPKPDVKKLTAKFKNYNEKDV